MRLPSCLLTASFVLLLSSTSVLAQDANVSPGGAEASPLQSLASAIYVVPDLAEAVEWYSGVLGFEPYFSQSFYAGFRIGEQELGLIPAAEGYGPGPGGSVPYWSVADAQATFDMLIERGATVQSPVTDVGGGVFVASVSDPYGNLIGIISVTASTSD